jgi:hypothetical protein
VDGNGVNFSPSVLSQVEIALKFPPRHQRPHCTFQSVRKFLSSFEKAIISRIELNTKFEFEDSLFALFDARHIVARHLFVGSIMEIVRTSQKKREVRRATTKQKKIQRRRRRTSVNIKDHDVPAARLHHHEKTLGLFPDNDLFVNDIRSQQEFVVTTFKAPHNNNTLLLALARSLPITSTLHPNTDTMKIVLLATFVAPAVSFGYLDSLSKANPVSYSAPSAGPSNGASYLDALASAGTRSAPTGAGIGSYLDNLGGGAAPAAAYTPAPAAYTPAAAAPVEYTPVSAFAPVAAGGNYLASLNTGLAVTAGGPGVTTYLDTIPRNAPVSGGAGIPTYKDALPTTNTLTGTGTGMNTYTDNLSGGSVPKTGYSPFGGSKAAFSPSFSGSAGGQEVGFTLEASDLSRLVQGMQGSGTIRLVGSIDRVSFS